MKLLIGLLIGLLSSVSLAAQTATKQGLVEYVIADKADSIRFYIYNPDNTAKTKIFLYIQGSGDLPMVNGDDAEACCYNNYPKKLMAAFPKEYAFVYIQKMGLPYYVRSLNDYKPGVKFIERNNVIDRAHVADKVVTYLTKKVYPKAKIVAVLGHSEGSDVAAKLAVNNKRVSHLGFSSGNGGSQALNDVLFLRRRMQKGEISAAEAQARLEELYAGLEGVYKKPGSTTDYYNGDTYKWNSAINEPPLDNLLRLTIPILVTIGSNDDKVPVEASDYIRAEFIRHRKTNLTYKVYLNSNHNYLETAVDGKKIDHWNEMFMDFLKFVSEKEM